MTYVDTDEIISYRIDEAIGLINRIDYFTRPINWFDRLASDESIFLFFGYFFLEKIVFDLPVLCLVQYRAIQLKNFW